MTKNWYALFLLIKLLPPLYSCRYPKTFTSSTSAIALSGDLDFWDFTLSLLHWKESQRYNFGTERIEFVPVVCFWALPLTLPPHAQNHILLRWGSVISRTNEDSQWNPVYKSFYRIRCWGTKQFISSNVYLILTWQTCGQRSSLSAGSKRRVLGNYFPVKICYVFLILKCRGDRAMI